MAKKPYANMYVPMIHVISNSMADDDEDKFVIRRHINNVIKRHKKRIKIIEELSMAEAMFNTPILKQKEKELEEVSPLLMASLAGLDKVIEKVKSYKRDSLAPINKIRSQMKLDTYE